ncbi:Putative Zinc finger, RING-type [Colletotrichum destructivum]|uniref:Zinc finger, RING-type n=1 Tax=Colletotrichum destructivum TaxID=34406 RepID=A0AAX4J1V7_9PEZI|nr:Putative Zinc finger, RING-type [Colletotrichum destructivum]
MWWINIQANAPGLPGVLLEENSLTYSTTTKVPQLLMVVGNFQKQIYLRRTFSKTLRYRPEGHIDFIHCSESMALVDCTLINALPKAQGGPVAAHVARYCLESIREAPPTAVQTVYSRLLYPFVSTLLFFADDFGGPEAAADVLAIWVSTSQQATLPPCLVVATNSTVAEKTFIAMVKSRMMQCTGLQAPSKPAEAERMLKLHFAEIKLTRPSDYVYRPRTTQQHRLTGLQLGQLFRLAINQLLLKEPFDLLVAWRSLYPSPTQAGQHLTQVCAAAMGRGINPLGILSSSLATDPLIHHLPAETVFGSYEKQLDDVQLMCRKVSAPGQLKQEFHERAAEAAALDRPCEAINLIVQSHLNDSIPRALCASCFIRTSTHALGCEHQLCDSCLVHSGIRQPAWRFSLEKCPICRKPSGGGLRVKPSTAAARVLMLPSTSAETTWNFLENLRGRLFGPLQDYFDLVISCSKVSPAQSAEVGLPRDSSLLAETSRPESRGSQIRRKLGLKGGLRLRAASSPQCYVAYMSDSDVGDWKFMGQDDLELVAEKECKRTWPVTEVYTLVQGASDIGCIGSLLSSCFYAEPCSSSHPDTFGILLRCRLSPGPHLLNLMLRLRDWKTPVLYRVGSRSWCRTRLCSEDTWEMLKSGQEYELLLCLDVPAFGPPVHIRIDTTPAGGGCTDISSSPFSVSDLLQAHDFSNATSGLSIQESRLSSNSTRHTDLSENRNGQKELWDEMEKLGMLLQDIIAY